MRSFAPGLQRDHAGGTVQAAFAALRRIGDAVEDGVDREFQIALGGDLHDLAGAAARAAGATGIRAQFLRPEDDRGDVLGGLDRHRAHAGGEGRGVQARPASDARRCRRS